MAGFKYSIKCKGCPDRFRSENVYEDFCPTCKDRSINEQFDLVASEEEKESKEEQVPVSFFGAS